MEILSPYISFLFYIVKKCLITCYMLNNAENTGKDKMISEL